MRGRLTATMPTAAVHDLEQRLPGLTQGEGFLFARPAGFHPVQGTAPRRRRTSLISLAVDGVRAV